MGLSLDQANPDENGDLSFTSGMLQSWNKQVLLMTSFPMLI